MPICLVNGVRISYRVYGQGVPVLFVPPPVVGSPVFQHQVEALSSEFRLILFDIRGHGKSDKSDRPLTYSVVVEDIRCLLDHLQIEKAVLCGYSMGASIVLEFVKTYPNRTMGAIPIGCFSEVSDIRLRTEISTAVALAKVRAMKTLAFGLALANADSLRAFQNQYRFGVKSNRDDVLSFFQCALTYNCTYALPRMTIPIRLLYGSNDRRIYRYAKILRRHLPNKEIIFVPGARHQIPLKNCRALNHHIRDFVHGLAPALC